MDLLNDEGDIRLDRFLRRFYPLLPQGFLEKSLRKKLVLVNGGKALSSSRLKKNDVVAVLGDFTQYQKNILHEASNFSLSPQEKKFLDKVIIFEDDELCVVNKPSGLAVQNGTGHDRSLDFLLNNLKKNVFYKLVHRLDKATSGLLLFAKTQNAARILTKLFKEKKVEKRYLAVVEGKINKTGGKINQPLLKDFVNNKEKIVVDPKGKDALTWYKLLQSNNTFSFVELLPVTGRMHQLRVHMAHIHHPIAGDKKYGASEKSSRLHLHAYKITFPYGKKGRNLSFTAPIEEKGLYSLFEDAMPMN